MAEEKGCDFCGKNKDGLQEVHLHYESEETLPNGATIKAKDFNLDFQRVCDDFVCDLTELYQETIKSGVEEFLERISKWGEDNDQAMEG